MKRIFALLLAAAMLICVLAGCGDEKAGTVEDTADSAETAEEPAETEEPEAPETYTYNYALAELPESWNPLTEDTAELGEYISAGLYAFDFNENRDGYTLVPFAASEEPENVTDEYIGWYGIEEGDENRAYVIKLRDDLKWQDGTPIISDDFVESAKRLLDPEAQNARAESFISGDLVIHNAKNYLYAGQTVLVENALNADYTMDDLPAGENGVYAGPDGEPVFLAVDYELDNWLSGATLSENVGEYGETKFDLTNWETLEDMMDENGLVPLTDESYELFKSVTTGNPNWGETEDDLPEYFVYEAAYPEIDWTEVGIFATSADKICIILDKPVNAFDIKYALSESWLVNTELYDSCAGSADGAYENSYCTSAETTMSFGPYMLTGYEADRQLRFEKNPNFFGSDADTYQTTNIVVDCVPEPGERLKLFREGKLDAYTLNIDDMDTYADSEYCVFDPGESVSFMVFNPALDALAEKQEEAGENINKTIIAVPEFRMAVNFALDRTEFCRAASPTDLPACSLFSGLIVADAEQGVPYLGTDAAKENAAKFMGVYDETGEGKTYQDLDEALNTAVGGNAGKAGELFDEAYDKAVELGYIDEDDVVEITIGTPNDSSAFYNNGYDYIVSCCTEAVKGTKLEDRLAFKRDGTLGSGFDEALKDNDVDILFGVGWVGSALDPFSMVEAFVNSAYQYDPAWDASAEELTVTVNDTEYTASVLDWYCIMSGETTAVTDADGSETELSCGKNDGDPAARAGILAAVENAILMNYDTLPLMDSSTAFLSGMQVELYSGDYIFGVKRGGMKYLSYKYSDAEWEEYVGEQGGELDYT